MSVLEKQCHITIHPRYSEFIFTVSHSEIITSFIYKKVTFSAALRTPFLHFSICSWFLQLSLSLCDELAPLLISNYRRSRIGCGRGTTSHLNSDHTTEWARGVAICDLDKTSICLTAHCTAAGSTSWDLYCERLSRQY